MNLNDSDYDGENMTPEEKKFYDEFIKQKNDGFTFYGFGCRVCFRENKYWLDYMSSGHGGFTIIKEITESEYLDVRKGLVSFSEIIDKYPEKLGDMDRSRSIEEKWKTQGIY